MAATQPDRSLSWNESGQWTKTTHSLRIKLRKLLHSRGRSPDESDDLIQEAFLRLQLYRQSRMVEQPEAFLVRTALNLSVDERRRALHQRNIATQAETLAAARSPALPDDVLATQQALNGIHRALNALQPRTRDVFLLRRAEGYSYAQIAVQLGLGLSTVERHMAKAKSFFEDWARQQDA